MYAREVPTISQWALSSEDNLADTILFVLLTIQQPLQGVAANLAEVKAKGLSAKPLFGAKRQGWAFIQEHKCYLFRVAHDILAREDGADRKVDLIQHFMQVPGIGIVKAAFIAQLIGAETACLDGHNLYVLDLSEDRFKVRSKVPAKVRAQIEEYVKICDRVGNSEHWWNRWCAYVAGRRGSPLKSADAVSAFHAHALGL
jgi:hypothetical protein